MNITEEIIAVLVAFGGGRGGEPGQVAVRFLLPSVFWSILACVAIREWRRTEDRKDLYVGAASLIGLFRELLMFTAEYGSLRGLVSFEFMYNFYPPLEHAATMFACIFIGASFMNYLLGKRNFSAGFLAVSSIVTLALYAATAPLWIQFLKEHPGVAFGTFWGDMGFRLAAALFMGTVLGTFVFARIRGARVPALMFFGFAFLFLDEFLMIFNIITHERSAGIYAPIRHNLHIWAIPLFLGMYWGDLKYRLSAALATARDERLKSEAVIAAMGDGLSIQDTDFNVLYQNQIHKEMVGEHTGQYCYSGYEKKDTVCEDCPVAATFEDGRIHRAVRSLLISGETKYFEITTSPLKDSSGRIIAGIEVVRDITERRRVKEALEAEKERLAVTLRSIGDAVIVTDIKGSITLINKVAEHNTGWSAKEATGRYLSEVFNIINERTREKAESPVDRAVNTGLVVDLANHTALIRKDGSEIIIEDSAAPIRNSNSEIIGVVLVFRDVTDKKRMEEEIIKAQKLESVGILAGGLAHDFNNLLTSILGNISVAKMNMTKGEKAYDMLEAAEKASFRATDLTRQLLTFSRGGAPVRKTASILDIIREAVSFTLSGSNVMADFISPDPLWSVDVDAGQMSQVFHNLVINAVQAMPNGGTITVTSDNITLAANIVPTLPAGEYVKISVADTGTGMSAEYLPRIFDPYFTTKQKGNGLGLSTVYSIIKKHEGHITVESRPGAGTKFHIYLKASAQREALPASNAGRISTGRGRVLVMDDDKLVRETVGELLGALGYEVAFAHDGAEALEIYRRAHGTTGSFAAVIMDLTIPGGMGGREAMQRLLQIDPEVKGIVSSGYSNDPVMAEFETHGFKGVISKPYTVAGLSEVLREVLAGS